MAGVELVEQMEDPCPALERLVELEMELRDPLHPEPLAELVPDERHRPAHRDDRRTAALGRADDADADLRVAEVGLRLDARDRGEPDPRVVDLLRQDRPDLLAEELVDPVRPGRHRAAPIECRVNVSSEGPG